MKVSVLAVLATAVLATARVVPSCDRENTDVNLFTEPPPLICLVRPICWLKRPRCPRGSFAKRLGKCWLCCKKRPYHPHGVEFEEEEFEGINEFDELD
jgi:hypothetical protein